MSYSSSSYYPRSYAYTKPNPPIGASGSTTGTNPGGSTASTTGDNRPSTLNLTSSASSTKPTYSLNPSKPSRYTPLPLSTNQTPAKSSSYTSLPAAAASSIATSAAAPGSLFASNYATGYGRKPPPQHQEVITGPPRSSSNLGYGREQPRERDPGHVPYYQTQMTGYRQESGLGGGAQTGHIPSNVTASSHHAHALVPPPTGVSMSKSSHSIMDSIPDVFCLSCPPAEFKFSDAYRAKTLPRTGKENERLIGFATLPEQVHRKSVKKGFDFTLMTVGESGLGKSTLINSLFLADFYQNRKIPSVNDQMKRTTSVQKHQTEIEERGVKLRLTVVDTPGFGDAINCENSWKACTDFIDDQFQQYFLAESGLNRRHIQDTRVHCCLYFVPPYGRGLRALDILALKHLQNRVNVIPVIGKADTLTPTEVKKLKEQILEDLRHNQIQIYQFPECDEEEDEEFKRQDRELKTSIPFAVSSSDTFVEVAGRKVRGRVYPWGIVEVENPTHSDFSKLRSMLIQSHMHDLKETTQDLHYENFRANKIAQISAGNNPNKERSKLRRDSPPEDSPQDLLVQKEAEIKRMQQMISKMEAKLKAAGKPSSRESRESTSSIDI